MVRTMPRVLACCCFLCKTPPSGIHSRRPSAADFDADGLPLNPLRRAAALAAAAPLSALSSAAMLSASASDADSRAAAPGLGSVWYESFLSITLRHFQSFAVFIPLMIPSHCLVLWFSLPGTCDSPPRPPRLLNPHRRPTFTPSRSRPTVGRSPSALRITRRACACGGSTIRAAVRVWLFLRHFFHDDLATHLDTVSLLTVLCEQSLCC
jgi:hypothetical protein